MVKTALSPIPSFYLYGDEARDEELDTLHVEPIRERSKRHDWIIHPHVHPDHTQILWISEGGADFVIEEERLTATAHSFVVQPAGMIHEIRFQPGTEGRVITASVSFLRDITQEDPRLTEITRSAGVYPLLDTRLTQNVRHAMEELLAEANTYAPGRRLARRAHFLSVLVSVMRAGTARMESSPGHLDKNYELVSRYREFLEKHFREQKSLTFYADALGVSPQRLNAACKARAGRTASEVLYSRILTEAKRCLLYTEMTVAEIGHSIGYDDPAYFNRFFSHRIGVPPGIYRTTAATTRRIMSGDGSSNTNF